MNRDQEVRILGVLVTDRKKEAGDVQKLLTNYGCSIRTRLGLHEVSDDYCSSQGLLILELFGDKTEQDKLEAALTSVSGVQVRKMVF